MDDTATPSLFTGIDAIISHHLGVDDYRTKTAAKSLINRPIDGTDFVLSLFEALRQNWDRALPTAKPTCQNFRWRFPKKNYNVAENNRPEDILERKLICACENALRSDWSNQVPILSGITGGRRAIDLVHKIYESAVEFIELKVRSNTQLYAAIEILMYGMFWLLTRQSRAFLGYSENPLLDASTLYLSTLAPAEFYTEYPLSEFSIALNLGVASLGKQNGVVMSFCQMAFPRDFPANWPSEVTDAQLIKWLDGREKLAETCA